MASKSGKITAAFIVGMILAATAWYVGSPYWTLHQMRNAAESQNADALASYIDFPSLRSSLKEEIKAQIIEESGKSKNPFMMMGIMVVDQAIDGAVTPALMRSAFASNKNEIKPNQSYGMSLDSVNISRKGTDEFWVLPENTVKGSAMIFKRHGFGWKLTQVRLPGGLLSGMGKS